MAKRAKTQKRETEFQIFNFEKIKIQINQFQVYFQFFLSIERDHDQRTRTTGTAPHLYYYCPIDYVVLSSACITMMCIHSTTSQLVVCC